MANRGIAPGKRQVLEMRNPAEVAVVGDHCLATPDCAIEAIAGPIKGDTDHGPLMAVFSHARGDMRMMMLHAHGSHAKAHGYFAPERLRMQIVSGDARRDTAHSDPFLQRIAKVILRRHALQRADVLAHQGVAIRQEAEAVLEVAAHAENRNWRCNRHAERAWCAAAAQPNRLRTTRPDDPDAVIAALMNRPVVQQERVDLIREYGTRFFAVPSERLSRQVGAGHNERASGIAHDQVMQR